MDLLARLKENQRQFDGGEINESEYNERRKSILTRFVESTETDSGSSGR